MKYLHQVSYLRLQDEIGVCLSYCCLSGTTCVLVVQYTAIWYNVYTCHVQSEKLSDYGITWPRGTSRDTGTLGFSGIGLYLAVRAAYEI